MAENIIYGLGVAEGIRFGQAFLYRPLTFREAREQIDENEIESELERLKTAKEKCLQELAELVEKTKQSLGEEKAVILKGQQSFLADPAFYPEMEKLVKSRQYSAEHAVNLIVEQFAKIFEGMANEYMRDRAADVRDVGKRLLAQLQGGKGVRLADINHEVILVADDLAPSDTVQLNRKFILGFVTRIGGKTSHTAILSRSLGIAAVLGVGDGLDAIQNGDFLIIDGDNGLCIINPEPNTVEEYRKKARREEEQEQSLQIYGFQPAMTKDGISFEIAANIGAPGEAEAALEQGAEGIGLYRTEFLFMSRNEMPEEEEQYRAYKEVASIMGDKPVVIRTLDIGGDKELPYLSLPREMNPFLGYRAIRIGLAQESLLRVQLRAILRASVYGKLKIMFPMISGMDEWRQAKRMYEEVRAELGKKKIPFDPTIELGIMIEVPSAAVLASRFAKEVDFFSIGTNDLVQYTVAVDRMNEKVAYLYDPFHPAVLTLVKHVIDAAHSKGKWVGMCGGMAGDPLAVPLLVGLGLDELSMAAGAIKKVKKVITQITGENCRKLLEQVLQLDTTEEIRRELGKFNSAHLN